MDVDPIYEDPTFYDNYEHDPVKALLRLCHTSGSGVLPALQKLKKLYDVHCDLPLPLKKNAIEQNEQNEQNEKKKKTKKILPLNHTNLTLTLFLALLLLLLLLLPHPPPGK